MLIVISSAKTLQLKPQNIINTSTQPLFQEQSLKLIAELRKLSPKGISELLSVNPAIALLNFERYAKWHLPFTPENAKQAILMFKGEVYNGLKAWSFEPGDFTYAQGHLRMLSGLYGLLRPLDLVQPYRLEMGIKLVCDGSKNIYKFWGNTLTDQINADLKKMKKPALINLASAEYFKVLNTSLIKAPLINIEFLENKNDKYVPIVVYLKKARGMLSRFIIKNQLTNPDDIKAFDEEGYLFNQRLSKERHLVFCRK